MKGILKYGISVIVGIVIGYSVCLILISNRNVNQDQSEHQESMVIPTEETVGSNAIQEWIRFRNNEDKYKGTTVTWHFKVAYLTRECQLAIWTSQIILLSFKVREVVHIKLHQ